MRLRRLTAGMTTIALTVGLIVATTVPADAAEPTDVPVPKAAQSTGPTDLRLAWNPVNDASGYVVQLSTDSSESGLVQSATTSLLSWSRTVLANVTEGTSGLWWRVAAYGKSSLAPAPYTPWTPVSQAVVGAPAQIAPAADATITFPDPTTFRWAAVPGAVNYTLAYTSGSFDDPAVTTTLSVGSTAYTPTAPLKRTVSSSSSSAPVAWNWRVRANFSKDGSSVLRAGTWSPSRSFVISWPNSKPTTYPASSPATDQSAPLGVGSVTDVRLAWDPVPGAARYRVLIGRTVGNPDVTPATQDSVAEGAIATVYHSAVTSATTYIPQFAMPDAGYLWQVIPVDPQGNEGARSSVRRFVKVWGDQAAERSASDVLARPDVVQGSTDSANPTEVSISDLELSWGAVPRASFYAVTVTNSDTGKSVACRTASTSATIIARLNQVRQGDNLPVTSPGLFTDGAPCLWSSEATGRIVPGASYSWSVKAFDLGAGDSARYQDVVTTNMLESQRSVTHYFTVTPARTSSEMKISVGSQGWAASSYEPTPTMTWTPSQQVPDGQFPVYEVEVAINKDFTNRVGWFYTPSTRMRLDGIFQSQTSDQPYYYRVRAGYTDAAMSVTNTVLWNSSYSYDIDDTEPISVNAQWLQRSTQIDLASLSATSVGPDVLLQWADRRPMTHDNGASRGYAVRIYDSQSRVVAELSADKPRILAQSVPKMTTTSGEPTKSVSEIRLPAGAYTFRVVALTASGQTPAWPDAGRPFEIASREIGGTSARVEQLGDAVTLSWAPTDADTYAVTVTGPDGRPAVTDLKVTHPAVTVGALTLPGTYTWSVQGYNGTSTTPSGASANATFELDQHSVSLNATGSNLGPRDVVLSWAPEAPDAGYLVRIATSAAQARTAAPVETRSTVFVPLQKLTFGTTYFWTVQPFGSSASGSRGVLQQISEAGSFAVVTPPSVPLAPSTTVDGTAVTATWTTLVAPATGSPEDLTYTLQYRPKPAGVTDDRWVDAATGRNLTSHTLTGLAQATTYQFRVRAINSVGSGPWSSVREQTTVSQPGRVTSLAVVPALGSLRVTWSAPATTATAGRAADYLVEYAAAGSDWTRTVVTGTSATLAGLAPGVDYAVRVAARNGAGVSERVSLSTVTLAGPGAPLGLKAARGDKSATLTWASPSTDGGSPITAYSIERSDRSGSGWTAWRTVGTVGTATTYKATGLKNGVAYQVRVIAKSRLGVGSASTPVTVTPAGKPLAPTSVKAKSTKKKTVKVTWKAANANGSKVTKYVIQYSTNGKSWKTLKTTASKSYTWKKAKSKKAYQFRVYAKNALGSGVKSSTARVTVK